VRAKSARRLRATLAVVHTRVVHLRRLRAPIAVRPLADGDAATVAALFDRLSSASRAARFHGAKTNLSDRELASLAAVDADRHSLVAYVAGDRLPAALARLVRDGCDPRRGELAVEVADRYHGLGIGTALVRLLLDDVRAAGIEHVDARVEPANRAAFALLRSVLGRTSRRFEDGAILVSSA
jgi:ribosomal protein S18 acetylase RimI-like enzyme